jgi:hypothetical protein
LAVVNVLESRDVMTLIPVLSMFPLMLVLAASSAGEVVVAAAAGGDVVVADAAGGDVVAVVDGAGVGGA